METSSVSRCVAIAAHGRRCQQSRFQGSPYCWHHTRSRKVFAPSRLQVAAAPPRPRAATEPRPLQALPEIAVAEPFDGLGERLVRAIGSGAAAEVLRVMEGGVDAALTIVKRGGTVEVRGTPRLRRARG